MEGVWLASYMALWCMVLIEGIAMAGLLRQIGVLHMRMQPTGARTMNAGPDIGSVLPDLKAEDISGRAVTIVDHDRARLLLFVSPTCTTCEELLPAVKTIARTENNLDIVLLTAFKDDKLNRSYVEKHKLGIPYVVSPRIAEEYGVLSTPYALVTDAEGVVRAKGLVNHLEHLESLIEALTTGHATLDSYIVAKRGSDGHGQ